MVDLGSRVEQVERRRKWGEGEREGVQERRSIVCRREEVKGRGSRAGGRWVDVEEMMSRVERKTSGDGGQEEVRSRSMLRGEDIWEGARMKKRRWRKGVEDRSRWREVEDSAREEEETVMGRLRVDRQGKDKAGREQARESRGWGEDTEVEGWAERLR